MVQKRLTEDIIWQVRYAKANGATVFYDIDDVGTGLLPNIQAPWMLNEMIALADLVTTDTDGHRQQILLELGAKNVAVLPDSIDYFPLNPDYLPVTEQPKPLRILWFGSIANMALFEKYVSVLISVIDVEIVVATSSGGAYGLKGTESLYQQKYPDITFVPWSRTTFVKVLQSCHLTCLMHDGSEYDQAKSNNRMITSITWGVPSGSIGDT